MSIEPTVKAWMDDDKVEGTRIVNLRALKKVLRGDRIGLSDAFIWDTSPQQDSYWRSRYNGTIKIDGDDHAFLLALLILHRRKK